MIVVKCVKLLGMANLFQPIPIAVYSILALRWCYSKWVRHFVWSPCPAPLFSALEMVMECSLR